MASLPSSSAIAISSPEEFAELSPEERETAVRTTSGSSPPGESARTLLMLGRPRTCVPGILTYALGWTTAGGEASALFFLGLLITLLYGLLANLYNAYTDLAEDSRNLPGRVWLVLRTGHRRVLWAGHALTVLILLLSPLYGAAYLLPASLALLGTHQYSFRPLRLKARPWLGLLAFSLAVFGPYLLGYFGASEGVQPLDSSAWALLAFVTLWFVAKGMVKNLPDVDGDRAAGVRTSATVFPDRHSAARAATTMTLVGYLSLPAFVIIDAMPAQALCALPWAVAAFLQCRAIGKAPDAASANIVLKRDMLLSTAFIATVVLLCAPGWASVASVLLGAFILLGSDRIALDSRRDRDSTDAAPA